MTKKALHGQTHVTQHFLKRLTLLYLFDNNIVVTQF